MDVQDAKKLTEETREKILNLCLDLEKKTGLQIYMLSFEREEYGTSSGAADFSTEYVILDLGL